MKSKHQGIGEFGEKAMGIYAEEVNLNRAVPDLSDGLKPVQRRILWASSNLGRDFVKTARLVGETMGKYHAHGDSSISGAVETIVHHNAPAITGQGGWGSLIDPAAAMRYTSCKLSHYGQTLFQKHYINKEVTSFVPNFDDTEIEPVSLPSMLPNVLLNGGEGIGVGTTTRLPTFTAESVVEMMRIILSGKKLEVKDFSKTLKFYHRWGGVISKNKKNKKEWMNLFTSASASIEFESIIKVDVSTKSIFIDNWGPGLDPRKFVDTVRKIPECLRVYNSKGATGFSIEMRKDYNTSQFDKFVEKVRKATCVKRSFKINVTRRKSQIVDGVVSFDTKILSLSVPKIFIEWIKDRIELEKRSLSVRIKNQKEEIAYSELLIYASSKLDLVFKALKAKDAKNELKRLLKIDDSQADQILDLQVRKLSALDQEKIKEKRNEQKTHLKQLEVWLLKPRAKIMMDAEYALDAIKYDTKEEEKKNAKLTVV